MMSAGPRRGRPTCREHKRFRQSLRVLAVLLVCLLFLGGCGSGKSYAKKRPLSTGTVKREKPAAAPKPKKQELPRLGYTIQAGAFKSAENAARFAETLKEKGLDATYFVAKTGLYRVSFGNFKQREDAESVAVILKSLGVIEDYYLVTPEQYTVAKSDIKGKAYLRRELVKTSRTFLGVP
ncbi:MAG: SPOR domain-containing protein [Syntrophales bacterium]|nr:SPOR domain-containing protein [Syntrophales bacterium]